MYIYIYMYVYITYRYLYASYLCTMGIYGQYVFVCFKTRWGSPQKTTPGRPTTLIHPKRVHETPGFPPGLSERSFPNRASGKSSGTLEGHRREEDFPPDFVAVSFLCEWQIQRKQISNISKHKIRALNQRPIWFHNRTILWCWKHKRHNGTHRLYSK